MTFTVLGPGGYSKSPNGSFANKIVLNDDVEDTIHGSLHKAAFSEIHSRIHSRLFPLISDD